MKRNFLLLLCVLALAVACLASCNNKHEHTFDKEWYSDATSHWHPATCEHGEVKDSPAAHIDADEDGTCDVCAFNMKHSHTYEADWSYDEENHWKNSTCSHTDEKGEFDLHSDEDMNGDCDICSGHVHNVNAIGYCTYSDCGKKIKEIDETNIDQLMAAIYYQKRLVNGGVIEYDFVGRSNTGEYYTATKSDVIQYVFGRDDYTYINAVSNSTNGTSQASSQLIKWNQLTDPETTFCLTSEDGGETLQFSASSPDELIGYYISLSTLAGEYGVENTLYALYQSAISEDTKDLVVESDAEGNKVTFKYQCKTRLLNATDIGYGEMAGSRVYNVNYFEVAVTVGYNDDFALTELGFVCDVYTNDPGTADGYGFLYKDVDIEYDPDTDTITFVEYVQDSDGNWSCIPTDKRTPDTYTVNVVQTVGERTEENPYPKSKFIPEGYSLYLGQNEEDGTLYDQFTGDTIQCNVSKQIRFFVGDCYPEGTSLEFVKDYVTVKLYKNGEFIEGADDPISNSNLRAYAYLANSGEYFFFIGKEDGAYRVEIYLMGELTHEININVGVVDEEYLELKSNEFAVKVTEAYEWANEVTFTAPEAGIYYFNVPAGVGFINADEFDAAAETPATDDGPDPYYDYNQHQNEDGSYNAGSFRLTLEEGQTVRFYVMAVSRQTYVISYYTL